MTNLPATMLPAIQPFVEGAVEEALKTIVEYQSRETQIGEEIAAAITEGEFQLRMMRIEMWWRVGGIIQDWHDACQKRLGEFVPLEQFCNAVGKKLGRSKESGYNAVQIRAKFPTLESLNELPFGKAVSLRLIVNKVIPGLNAGKTIQEIAQEDAQEMRQSQAAQPRLLYDGPARLDVDEDDGWIVELPDRTQLKAWPGQEIWVKIWEQR